MPTINYIAPVLQIRDLADALTFYRDTLGFEVEFIHGDFYASVISGQCRIHLSCSDVPRRNGPAFEAAEVIDVCIAVGNATDLFASLFQRGVRFAVELREMPYGREFYVRDPDDYILAFIEPKAD